MGSRSGEKKEDCVDQFPGSSVRSSHKLRAFEQQKWVLSQAQRSEVQSQNVVRLCQPHLRGLRDDVSTAPSSCRCHM